MQGYWLNLINFPPSKFSTEIKCHITPFNENILSQKNLEKLFNILNNFL